MVNRSLTRGRRGKNLFLFADGFQKSALPSNRQVSIYAGGALRRRKSAVRRLADLQPPDGSRLPSTCLAVLIADKLAVLVARLNRHAARAHAAEWDAEKLRGAALQLECAWLRSIEAARPAWFGRLTTAAPRNRCSASLQCYSLVIFFNSVILRERASDQFPAFAQANWLRRHRMRQRSPHPLGSCKFAKRKIRFANQHSPLERTFFLTWLLGSRLDDLTPALLHRRCLLRDLSGLIRPMAMGAFVVPNKGRCDAYQSRDNVWML